MSAVLAYMLLLSPFFVVSALLRKLDQNPSTVFFSSLILAPLAFILSTWIGFTMSASLATLFFSGTLWVTFGIYLWKRNTIQLRAASPERTHVLLFLTGFLLYGIYARIRPFSEHDTFEYMALGEYLSTGFNPFNYRYNPENGFFYVGYHPPVYALFFSISSLLGDAGYLSVKTLSGYFYLSGSLLAAGFLSRNLDAPFWFVSMLIFFCFGWLFSALQFHLETMRMATLVLLLITAFQCFRYTVTIHSWVLFGAICGFVSGVHFINLVVCCTLALAAALQYRRSLTLQNLAGFGLSFFLSGGFYYLSEFFEKSSFYSFG